MRESLIERCRHAAASIDSHYYCDINSKLNNRAIFALFSGKDKEWTTEVTLPMYDKAQAQNMFNFELIRECLHQIIKENYGIPKLGASVDQLPKKVIRDAWVDDKLLPAFKHCERLLDSIQKPVLVINDAPRSGKTLFVKWYLKQKLDNANIYWMDFNCGNMDFARVLFTFLTTPPTSVNYFVLDNLECCGFSNSKKVLQLFVSLVSNANSLSSDIRQRLIIIQDSTMPIFNDYSEISTVDLFDRQLTTTFGEKKDLYSKFTDISYKNVCDEIRKFLDSPMVEPSTKALLAKVLFFSKNGIMLISRDQNREKLKRISGIRITKNDEIISYSSDISKRLVEEEFAQDFEKVLSKDVYSEMLFNFVECYYGYLAENTLKVNISDLYQILLHTKINSQKLRRLKEILKKAEEGAISIARKVLQASDGEIFSNHLGVILFSEEALTAFSNRNWTVLHALEKLRNHVRDCYIVDSRDERLPQISPSFLDTEGTYKDFRADSIMTSNCIENQIFLQNDVLAKTHFDGKNELQTSDLNMLREEGLISDSIFDLYLSKVQNENSIDINKFYGTYILAVLFEFEVNLPDELRDDQRIQILWRKIQRNCCKSGDPSPGEHEFSYFYPKRVPWVTARMMLALHDYSKLPNPNHKFKDKMEEMGKRLAVYLYNCSIRYEENGKAYRFWAAGTGYWNSALETSILCTFAIQQSMPIELRQGLEEGYNFIESFSSRWFDEKMLADGIWAYRTIRLENLTKANYSASLNDFAIKTKEINFHTIPQNKRNDKSLGESHIAKTYIDSVLDFIVVNPSISGISFKPLQKGKEKDPKKFTVKKHQPPKELGAPKMQKKTIFLSYAQKDMAIADGIDRGLQKFGYDVKRDVHDLKQWESIRSFMKTIRKEDYVVFLVSDTYLRRENCIFEVMQFLKDENNDKRAFPIAVSFTDKEAADRKADGLVTSMFDFEYLVEIVSFWQKKAEEVKKKISAVEIENRAELDASYREIKNMAQSVSQFLFDSFRDKLLKTINPEAPDLKNVVEAIHTKVTGEYGGKSMEATERLEEEDNKMTNKYNLPKVLLVVATSLELQVLLKRLEAVSKVTKTVSAISYFSATIGNTQTYVVKSQMGQGGVGGAILTLEEAIRVLKPDYVIMGGIAWGGDKIKQHIGDLLISSQVWDYDIERKNPDGSTIYRGAISPSSPRLVQMFEVVCATISSYKTRCGLVASGSDLYDNKDCVNELKAVHSELIGGDMESAGMASVCTRKKVDWIMAKGICDWGYDKNDHKDEYQELAANNSMDAIVSLLLQFSPQ